MEEALLLPDPEGEKGREKRGPVSPRNHDPLMSPPASS